MVSLATALAVLAGIQPFAGETVSGMIPFPRAQKMSITVRGADKLELRLGFDGRCDGGGLGELWMSSVPATSRLTVRDGRFSGRLTGSSRGIGGRPQRVAKFSWRVSGRFTDHGQAVATVSGSALVREHGKAIARCETRKPAKATLRRAAS
jgi:Periviscerokinin family